MKIIQNTYPEHPNIPHAEIGDIVHWEHGQCFKLIRDVDNKTLFMTASVNRDGNLRSNNMSPILIGIIAQVKSKNFILKVQ